MRASVILLVFLLHGCDQAPPALQDGRWQRTNTERQEHCKRWTIRMIGNAAGVTPWLINDIYMDCMISNGAAI
jgi:hypothetical protein